LISNRKEALIIKSQQFNQTHELKELRGQNELKTVFDFLLFTESISVLKMLLGFFSFTFEIVSFESF